MFAPNKRAFPHLKQMFAPVKRAFERLEQMFTPRKRTFAPVKQMFGGKERAFLRAKQSFEGRNLTSNSIGILDMQCLLVLGQPDPQNALHSGKTGGSATIFAVGEEKRAEIADLVNRGGSLCR